MKYAWMLLLVTLGCGGMGAQPSGMDTSWHIIHSNPMPGGLEDNQFYFPVGRGFVGYLVRSYSGPAPTEITMSYRVEGDGVFDANWQQLPVCYNPASVTVMVEVRGDNQEDENGRWWAGSSVLVDSSELVTVVIPTRPELWTNVMGRSGGTRAQQFESALGRVGTVGMTFGGCSSYGHGVRLSTRKSRFTLVNYSVK
jgi:hypothetical protein